LTLAEVKWLDLDLCHITAGERAFEQEAGWTLRKREESVAPIPEIEEIFLRVFGFYPVSIISSILHTHLYLKTVLIRRTSGRILQTLKQRHCLSDVGEHSTQK
jgi:hypothetical protein